MWMELLQIAGALVVLVAFAASQAGRLDARSVPYLVANVVGAGLLAALALVGRDWGFVLLEGVWAAVSAASLVRRVAVRSAAESGAQPRRPASPREAGSA